MLLLLDLITEIASSCTQQPGLSSTGWGKRDSWAWGCCFPSGWCPLEESARPEKDGLVVWGMTQPRDPGGCSFSSLPRATSPILSTWISSPLCPPSARSQGKCLQMTFYALPFKRLSASLAVAPWHTETLLLFTAKCYLGSFPSSGALC